MKEVRRKQGLIKRMIASLGHTFKEAYSNNSLFNRGVADCGMSGVYFYAPLNLKVEQKEKPSTLKEEIDKKSGEPLFVG